MESRNKLTPFLGPSRIYKNRLALFPEVPKLWRLYYRDILEPVATEASDNTW